MLKFHLYSILTGETIVGFVIYCVLSMYFDDMYVSICHQPYTFIQIGSLAMLCLEKGGKARARYLGLVVSPYRIHNQLTYNV